MLEQLATDHLPALTSAKPLTHKPYISCARDEIPRTGNGISIGAVDVDVVAMAYSSEYLAVGNHAHCGHAASASLRILIEEKSP